MNKKSTSKITVSARGAQGISFVIGIVVFLVILAWLWINAETSVIGIQIALGTTAWVTAIGLAFPASDVIAIVVDLVGRFIVDEDGDPVISQDTVRLVWVLWFVAAFLDIALTFYVFDKLNYEQFASGQLYDAGLITAANRRWIPGVLAVATYALTVLIIHGSRGIIGSALQRYIKNLGGRSGGSGNGKTRGNVNKTPPPPPNVFRPFENPDPAPIPNQYSATGIPDLQELFRMRKDN